MAGVGLCKARRVMQPGSSRPTFEQKPGDAQASPPGSHLLDQLLNCKYEWLSDLDELHARNNTCSPECPMPLWPQLGCDYHFPGASSVMLECANSTVYSHLHAGTPANS